MSRYSALIKSQILKLLKFNILFILLLSISFIANAQKKPVAAPNLPIDDDTKLITYKAVKNETGDKDELYERGMLWVKKFYKNPSDVLRDKDKENSKIKCIARFVVYSYEKDLKTPKATIEYTLVLECKDGRYRYTITNFNVKRTSYFPIERWLNKTDPEYDEKNNLYLTQLDSYVNTLLESLVKEMHPKDKKDDNW